MGALLAAAVVLLPGPGPAAAASCNGASHTLSLSAGRVDPGSGTAGATFRFSVTYRDTGNCAPNYVRVRIAGFGTFAMSASGRNWDGGERFSRNVKLSSIGSHAYVFQASSGSGGGTKAVELDDVRPATVRVEAPKPKPTPRPTAVPTPRPTVAPTRAPQPTARPTRQPTSSPAARTERPRRSREPSASPSDDGAALGPGPTQRPGGFRWPPRPRQAPSGFDPFALRLDGTLVRVGQWGAITAGGLLLLLVLSARHGEDRRRPGPVLVRGGFPPPAPAPSLPSGVQAEAPGPERSPPAATRRRDETNMPRWLRPSVQAGRQGRDLED